MWNTNLVRLFGVLIAVVLIAAACGSTATTDTADASADDASAIENEATEEIVTDDDAMDDMDMGEDEHDDHGEDDHEDEDHADSHDHEHAALLEVDASLPIPAIDIELTETDTAGTFAIAVSLENFTITPENVDGAPIDNEGHMHLLVDGVKIERFTDLEHQVSVSEGEHLVEVEINANNHAAYTVDGEPIRAGFTVTGAGEAPAGLTAADATVTLTASVVDGSVDLDGEERLEVAIGDVVMVMVSSNSEDEVHVHGYDLLADVADGSDAMIVFVADTPGRFEIEMESSGLFIAELVVS